MGGLFSLTDGLAQVVATQLCGENVQLALGVHDRHSVVIVHGQQDIVTVQNRVQCINPGLEALEHGIHPLFQSEDGGDGLCILTGALHDALFIVHRQIHNGCNGLQFRIDAAQTAADEDDVRLAGGDLLQVCGLDGAQIHDRTTRVIGVVVGQILDGDLG